MLEATIAVGPLKTILKGLQAIGEESILEFGPEGLIIRLVDTNRIKVLQVSAEADAFNSYQCDDNYRLGVMLSRLKDITKSLTTKDTITMTYNDSKFTLAAKDMERTIKLLRLELLYELKAMPTYEYTFNTEIESSKEIRDYLKTLDKIPVFQISLDDDSMTWQTLEKEEQITWKPELDLQTEEEFSLLFTTQHMTDIVAATSKETIKVRGGDEIPLEFQWTPHEGIQMTGLIAPRV